MLEEDEHNQIAKVCPTARGSWPTWRNPKDPIHEFFLRTHAVQILKPYMATGAKVFYNGMDGSVR